MGGECPFIEKMFYQPTGEILSFGNGGIVQAGAWAAVKFAKNDDEDRNFDPRSYSSVPILVSENSHKN